MKDFFLEVVQAIIFPIYNHNTLLEDCGRACMIADSNNEYIYLFYGLWLFAVMNVVLVFFLKGKGTKLLGILYGLILILSLSFLDNGIGTFFWCSISPTLLFIAIFLKRKTWIHVIGDLFFSIGIFVMAYYFGFSVYDNINYTYSDIIMRYGILLLGFSFLISSLVMSLSMLFSIKKFYAK